MFMLCLHSISVLTASASALKRVSSSQIWFLSSLSLNPFQGCDFLLPLWYDHCVDGETTHLMCLCSPLPVLLSPSQSRYHFHFQKEKLVWMQNLLKDNSATWWAQVLEFFVCLLIYFLPLLLGWFVGSLFRFIHNVTFRHKDNKKIMQCSLPSTSGGAKVSACHQYWILLLIWLCFP